VTLLHHALSSVIVHALRCEYQETPLGIDIPQPRLNWVLASKRRGTRQSAYQVQVTSEQNQVWDTGKVLSDQSIHVAYAGRPLQSRQRYTWRVRVWDEHDQVSEWSEATWWEMGLLQTADWRARWIEPDWDDNPEAFKPAPYLRAQFETTKPVVAARIYATAHGLYELSLNGQRVGDAYFTPGYTSYHKRLQYQTYDVTALVSAGENALGAILSDGWYRGQIAASSRRNVYGDRLALLLQLELRYADGSTKIVTTDERWRATTGPLLKADFKDGEIYDARLEMPGWDRPGFNDKEWQGIRLAHFPLDQLIATAGPLVRRKEEFPPVALLTTLAGETVADLGQNFAGVVRLRVQGPAGTIVKVYYGETLDEHGNFTMKNMEVPLLAKVSQEDHYILKGDGEEIYTPRFTTHGFRYVKVEGFPGQLSPEQITGIALYSDLPGTGTFSCSNALINQLEHNILWSQKGNFLEIPTDCPTRERSGWTGDAQIFARTGSFHLETAGFLTKWLKDLAAEQGSDGMVPNRIPSPPASHGSIREGSAGWGDAAVLVPWTLYQIYGDRRLLEEQYPSMQAWVEYERRNARNWHWVRRLAPVRWFSRKRQAREAFLWNTKYHWGEWLEPGDVGLVKMIAGILWRTLFSAPLVATAYFARSTSLLAEIARVLGKDDDAREYAALYRQIKEAYIAEFIGKDGRIRPDKQASYVRVLAFDLLPEQLRPVAVQRLVQLVKRINTHLDTGFLSTPFLCHVLSTNGYLDVAYDLLLQETAPSWLYAVKRGATTIWESWEGIKEDGTPQLSLNHYSYGSVGEWLYQVVAGLNPGAPGYKQIIFQPCPGGGLTHAGVTYQSLYGEIASWWQLQDGTFTLTVTVPPNTTASVHLLGSAGTEVKECGQPLETSEGIKQVHQESSGIIVEIDSGTYTFTYAIA
jgi:alpha-L-rhamnosidase